VDITFKNTLALLQAHRYWELIQVLVTRNLKGRYRGSFLGVYWSLLNPLVMTGLYTAIFGTAFSQYYDNSIPKYVLAVFTGLIILNFFSTSTMQGLSSVVGNGGLLNKIRVPISIFPVSMVAANIFQFVVGALPLLVIVTLFTSGNILNVLALSFPLLGLIFLCMGVSFLVSALYVSFRDLPYFYELLVFALTIATPIFYPPEILPEKIRPLLLLNPLLPVIESIRQIALSGKLPDFTLIGNACIGGVVMLILGWSFFRWKQSQFMDLL
jgi:ABC-type polysaccharide/polyol phosphate export permease